MVGIQNISFYVKKQKHAFGLIARIIWYRFFFLNENTILTYIGF